MKINRFSIWNCSFIFVFLFFLVYFFFSIKTVFNLLNCFAFTFCCSMWVGLAGFYLELFCICCQWKCNAKCFLFDLRNFCDLPSIYVVSFTAFMFQMYVSRNKKEGKEKVKGQFDDMPMIAIVDGKRKSGEVKKE